MTDNIDHDTYLVAKTLADTASKLLKEAAGHIQSTSPPGICIGGTPRALNYWVCDTGDRADRMSRWIEDYMSGKNEFCAHGQPPYIVKAALCEKCERKAERGR